MMPISMVQISLDLISLEPILGMQILGMPISGSTLGTNTLTLSKGKIPKVFLRGCGLSDWEIESAKLYNPDLTNPEMDEILYRVHDIRAHQPIQISNPFISYSHKDEEFAIKLENSFNDRGIRSWRDDKKLVAGRLEKQLDRAIRLNPIMIVILSKHSLMSDWVELEVRTARELEKELRRDVLCPVALDDSWQSSRWPKRHMAQITEYNILDFSKWNDEGKFNTTFEKLIDGLNLFYKKEEE